MTDKVETHQKQGEQKTIVPRKARKLAKRIWKFWKKAERASDCVAGTAVSSVYTLYKNTHSMQKKDAELRFVIVVWTMTLRAAAMQVAR